MNYESKTQSRPLYSTKIVVDLIGHKNIELLKSKEEVMQEVQELFEQEIKKEEDLERAVNDKLENLDDEVFDEFEYIEYDVKQVFWMAKKKLASEFGVILNFEDRYNNLAHTIIMDLFEKEYIDYEISENRIKNIIFDATTNYINSFDEIEREVANRISHYKRELIPGTEDYDLVYQKLYQEELIRKGLG